MDMLTSAAPGPASEIWQQLADYVPHLVWMATGEGTPYWFNRRCSEFTGLPADKLVGEGWSQVIHPDERDRVKGEWLAAVAAGQTYESLYRLRASDGSFRHFLARAEPHRGEDGLITGWFGTSTDNTVQVEAERQNSYLLRLEEVLRSAGSDREAKSAVIRLLGEELQADRVHFSTPDLERLVAHVGDQYLAPGISSVAGSHQFSREVLALYSAGKPVVTDDFREHSAWAEDREWPEIADLPVRAVLDVPLVRNGRLISVLSVHQTVPRHWTSKEVELAVGTAARSWNLVEKARAERALSEANTRFQAVLDNTEMAVFLMNEHQHCVYANSAAELLTGYSLAEMQGRPLHDVVHHKKPDGSHYPLEDCPIDRAFPERAKMQGEELFVARDGSFYPVAFTASPVVNDAGRPIGTVIEARNIAEERARKAELEASEAQFRTLAEALPGMLFITTAEGGNSYVNETFASFSGLPKEDLLGTGWSRLLHPDDRQRTWNAWQQAVASGQAYEVEYRLQRHDGQWRWFAARALRIPSTDSAGHEMWVGTCTDIHEAKTAGQEVAAAEARYRAVFEQAGVGVARVSAAGDFLEVNDRYCEILKRDRKDILGQGWRQLTHPDDVAKDVAQVDVLLRGERDNYSFEKRYLAPDGSSIWVNLTVAAQRDDKGQVQFFIPVVQDISARKQAESDLRSSEERYRALFESMEQGFCIIQVEFDQQQRPCDYRFTELNPAFVEQSGLGRDVLGRSIQEAVPGLEQSWFDRYGEVAQSGLSQRFVDHSVALGRWFEVYAFPIGQRSDNNIALLFSDITERKEQEDALRRSEQQLRLRLNAIPQMVWSTLPDGFHDFYNDRWYEFTGTPLGSTDGEGWNGMFHPEDQANAWKTWKQSLATGEPYEIEYRLRHHTGTYRWVLGRALPIRDEAGDIVRWMGTCTDIDDRIAAARALRESEERLRAVFEAVPVGLIFSDANGRLTGSNQLVLDLIGHDLVQSANTDTYKDDYVAFHADGRQVESHEYPLARALAGEARPELECRVQRGDGSLRWLRYVAAPFRDDEGKIAGGVVASIDVDREKRLTEGLEREVERVIAEREAAQEALRQSQKIEAMGQLTGGVAHDFNNLLTPIIGSLDLLMRKQILDDRTARLVDGALASAEKARVLVQRLLAFARRQPLKPQPIDLKRVIDEMSELIDSTSGPRIRVVADVPDMLPPALADGNQLEMALLNLSVNARDAMPEGGTLTIAARLEQGASGSHAAITGKPHIVLAVSDTGIGMDDETLRRAVEPFFSTKGIGKGTGLGLSMVHGLAAQLGGALDIRSAPGMGTTIELRLPLATGEVANGKPGDNDAEAHGVGTALLVDDEELVRASTAGMLADLGYRVVEASCGEEALALVNGGLRPNLLVTDQLMPGLSGTDLAFKLREQVGQLPVLIVSGYADLESLSPAFPHLSKPFRQSELAAALDKAVA